LLISGLDPQPTEVLESTGLLSLIGMVNVFARTGPALDFAISQMDVERCAECPYAVFRECEDLKYRGVQQFNRQQQSTVG